MSYIKLKFTKSGVANNPCVRVTVRHENKEAKSAIIHFIIYNCVFPTVPCQNIYKQRCCLFSYIRVQTASLTARHNMMNIDMDEAELEPSSALFSLSHM